MSPITSACIRFRDRIDAFLAGALGREDREACVRHVGSCRACAALVGVLAEAASAPPAVAPEGLLAGVLARTTGPTCRAAALRLAEGGAGDADLAAHLAGCEDCSTLDAALRALADDLPRLAVHEDTPDLVAGVLARTTGTAPRASGRLRALASIWVALVRRPRFALEVSYAVVLLGALVLGVPDVRPSSEREFSALADVSGAIGSTASQGAGSAGRAGFWFADRFASTGRGMARGLASVFSLDDDRPPTPATGDDIPAAAGASDEHP